MLRFCRGNSLPGQARERCLLMGPGTGNKLPNIIDVMQPGRVRGLGGRWLWHWLLIWYCNGNSKLRSITAVILHRWVKAR